VTVVTTAGRMFTSTVDAPRGSGPRGIEWADVDAKYRTLISDSKLATARSDQLLDMIHGFDRVKNVSAFTRLLAPRG
jgi:2-methylcitrate dehydratase PrpD